MKTIVLALSLLILAPGAWAESRSITLEIPGMSCAACPITVKKALSRVDGVQNVEVSYPTRSATVKFDDQLTSAAALARATEEAGYSATVRATP